MTGREEFLMALAAARFPRAAQVYAERVHGGAPGAVELGRALECAWALTAMGPPPATPRMREPGYLYAAQIHAPGDALDGRLPVKVGFTRSLRRRIEVLANGLPWGLRYLFALQGVTSMQEHEVHAALRGMPGLHMRGEWYTAQVLPVLRELTAPWLLGDRAVPHLPAHASPPPHRHSAPQGKRHGRPSNAPIVDAGEE